ncbi:MAG: arginase [Flavobacteriales bacterium]|jgi:formiminoglutamase
MLDLTLFFQPPASVNTTEGSLYHNIHFFPESITAIERNSICIFHVNEYRGRGEENQPMLDFRSACYSLFPGQDWNMKIYDLGDMSPGASLTDTYFAVQTVVGELIKNSCIPVLVGGSMDLLHAVSVGYEVTEQLINICAIDERISLGKPDEEITSDGYLSSLLLRRPCYLFNHATIGLQPNRNNPMNLDLYDKLYFDVCRLGAFNADFKLAEPILRNSDIIGMNLEALKASERMVEEGNPNGFTVEQFCQIAKYSGISDKLSCFGIFNPVHALGQDSAIVAHTLWYLVDGIESRKGDFPIGSKKEYMRFTVIMDNEFQELVFYKSNKSERWWMEVPYPPSEQVKFERHHLVPCDQQDYENAMKNELPDLWWRTYQKLG